MQLISIILSLFFFTSNPMWQKNLQTAEVEAKKEHKLILLNFSGSDWCGPCIKMEKEIFETSTFQQYATKNLVLVNADFPRSKKHQLDKTQKSLNEAMADTYNKSGIFPLTLLLDANGKVLKKWEGVPAANAEKFIALLQENKK
ncbi:MAG: thioredoxin family protein [Adhaeribacter sp.]